MGKDFVAFFVCFLSVVNFGYAESLVSPDNQDDEWPIVAITAQNDWYDWYYEQVKPDSWLLVSSEQYIAEDGTSDEDVRAIVYRDEGGERIYPIAIYVDSRFAEPVAAEKVEVCGSSAMAITLRTSLMPHNPVNAEGYDGPLYGYERIFLNLERERQSVQIDDDYSTRKAKSNVPLAEFLEVKKFTCEDNFIVFPDSDNGDT